MLTLKHSALSFVVLVVAAGCGGNQGGVATKPATAPTASASAAAVGNGSQGQQSPQAPAFACSSRLTGGSSGGQLTDVRVASHPGFDRITFQFESRSGVPEYRLTPQSSASFTKDPSGLPLDLDGSAGLAIVFPSSSGVDLSVTPYRQTYNGSRDIKAGLPFVREVAEVGDFERVLSWGVGLSSAPCLRLTELSDPARLAIDVRSAS